MNGKEILFHLMKGETIYRESDDFFNYYKIIGDDIYGRDKLYSEQWKKTTVTLNEFLKHNWEVVPEWICGHEALKLLADGYVLQDEHSVVYEIRNGLLSCSANNVETEKVAYKMPLCDWMKTRFRVVE